MVFCGNLWRKLLIYFIRNQVYIFECQCIVGSAQALVRETVSMTTIRYGNQYEYTR